MRYVASLLLFCFYCLFQLLICSSYSRAQTVMPHALFIGSRLATVDRLDLLPVPAPPPPRRGNLRKWRLPSSDIFGMLPSSWRRAQPVNPARNDAAKFSGGNKSGSVPSVHELHDRKDPDGAGSVPNTLEQDSGNLDVVSRLPAETPFAQSSEPDAEAVEADNSEFNRLDFIRQHITHATVDIVFSLVGFAITINSAILIIAAAAFYKNPEAADADLFAAHHLIGSYLGSGPALLFAIALLCSGQSASISCTLAGQVVSEGFIEWRTSPLVRRLVTRLIGMVPSMVVATAVGRSGIDTLLVVSQVILSIVLPFVVFPLVWITSSNVMVVNVPSPAAESTSTDEATAPASPDETGTEDVLEVVSFKNGWAMAGVGYLIFTVVVVANTYVIVALAMGTAG